MSFADDYDQGENLPGRPFDPNGNNLPFALIPPGKEKDFITLIVADGWNKFLETDDICKKLNLEEKSIDTLSMAVSEKFELSLFDKIPFQIFHNVFLDHFRLHDGYQLYYTESENVIKFINDVCLEIGDRYKLRLVDEGLLTLNVDSEGEIVYLPVEKDSSDE